MVELQRRPDSLALLDELDRKYGETQLPLEKRIIPSGYDSDVYRFKRHVFKLYSPEITADSLELYKKVTNEASFLSYQEDWKLYFRDSRRSFPLRVNEFGNFHYWGKRACFVGISCFVGGKNWMI